MDPPAAPRAGLRSVQTLDLAFTRVTDAGLLRLASAAPALRELTVARSHSNVWTSGLWTDAGLAALQRARPELAARLVSC
jgi:hypothetical protein